MKSTTPNSDETALMILLHRLAVCLALAALGQFPAVSSLAANGLNPPAHARQLAERISPLDSYALPTGPFVAGAVPAREVEGRVVRQSWRLDGAGQTTLQVLIPLRAQLLAAGYEIVLDCRDLTCGGFDFRFRIEVITAPDMHVNIRDYRFLGAVRGEHEVLGILVSRAGNSTYIQVIHTSAPEQEHLRITSESGTGPQVLQQPPGALAAALEAKGHVVLGDLVFETGAGQLGKGPFVSLVQLAEFLKVNPGFRIALVGHTDSVGSLTANISLSKRRAGSVRARMIDQHAIAPAQIEAEGMGYLAPVASNLTREGREANRRVEAILLSQ